MTLPIRQTVASDTQMVKKKEMERLWS